MKNRDFFLPSFTTLIISGMMMFLSCASPERMDDDISMESTEEQSVSENGTEETQNISDVTELTEGETPAQTEEATQTNEDINQLTSNENTATSGDPTLDALGMPEGQNAVGGTDQAALEGSTGSAAAESDPTLALGAEGAAATTEPALDVPPSDSTLANNNLETAGMDATTPPTDDFSSTSSEPKMDSTPTFDNAPRSYGGVRTPKVPTRAVTKKGVALNRFYFLRKGDTPKSVAQLIYGEESRATTLAAWNGGKKSWKAGKMIYYSSPSDAEDGEMRSFYQERQVPSEDYQVKRGDWLSRIATKKLGSAGSWKEVAVVNGMASPDALEVGQKLAVYPRDLTPFSFENQQTIAKNDVEEKPRAEEAPTPVVKNPEPVQQEAVQNPTAPGTEQPTAEAMPTPPQEPAKKAPAKSQKLDFAKIVEQNFFAIVIGGGAIVLLLALSAINRRKRARGGDDNFNEDGFAPPSKLKRK